MTGYSAEVVFIHGRSLTWRFTATAFRLALVSLSAACTGASCGVGGDGEVSSAIVQMFAAAD
jgi:hypothetical protein